MWLSWSIIWHNQFAEINMDVNYEREHVISNVTKWQNKSYLLLSSMSNMKINYVTCRNIYQFQFTDTSAILRFKLRRLS